MVNNYNRNKTHAGKAAAQASARGPLVGLEGEAVVPPVPQSRNIRRLLPGIFRQGHNSIIKLAMKVTNDPLAQDSPKPFSLANKIESVCDVHGYQLKANTTRLVHGLSSQLIRQDPNSVARNLARNNPWMKRAPWDRADRCQLPFLTWKIMLLILTEMTIHRIPTTGRLLSSTHT